MGKSMLSAIKRIENEASKMPNVISLAQGIPSFSSDEKIRGSVISAINENKVDKYSLSAGISELRCAIGKNFLTFGLQYDPEKEIIVTAGAIEALSAALLALLERGDEVIVFTPTYYSYYSKITLLAGGKIIEIPLEEKNEWKINFSLLRKKITKRTRIIILCNPNNPTGSIVNKSELTNLASIIEKYKLILINDSIYQNLSFTSKKIDTLSFIKKLQNRIINIMSFSKDFALSGWRIGGLCGPADLVEKILVVHDCLVNCAPVVSQYAALAALKNENRIINSTKEGYSKRRIIMGNYLKSLEKYLSFSWPDGAYYFFPKIYNLKNSEDFCFDLLRKNKLAVVPGSDFGPGGEGHIRLCFGRSETDINEGMRRLSKYLRSIINPLA